MDRETDATTISGWYLKRRESVVDVTLPFYPTRKSLPFEQTVFIYIDLGTAAPEKSVEGTHQEKNFNEIIKTSYSKSKNRRRLSLLPDKTCAHHITS
jgi:hypothetical protein